MSIPQTICSYYSMFTSQKLPTFLHGFPVTPNSPPVLPFPETRGIPSMTPFHGKLLAASVQCRLLGSDTPVFASSSCLSIIPSSYVDKKPYRSLASKIYIPTATFRRLRLIFDDDDFRDLGGRVISHSLREIAPGVDTATSLHKKLLEAGVGQRYVTLQVPASAAQQGGVLEHDGAQISAALQNFLGN